MNFEKKGQPVFKIYSNKGYSNKHLNTAYVDCSTSKTDSLKLRQDEYTQLIPSNKERDILYITGASGSGKSYFSLRYLEEYNNKYPDRPVYLFSSLSSDKTLDSFGPLKRVLFDEQFIDTDFVIEDFKDCICVFDDVDVITNKFVRAKVKEILDMILETGRHTNTSCIYTSHLPAKGFETKRILNEAHSITFFCNGLGASALKYLMEKHIGLDKKQRNEVRANGSRATTFVKSFPSIILYDKGAYTLCSQE